MGRTAKPTIIKKLEGNPGKKRLNKNEPIARGTPSPPRGMSANATAIWKRVAGAMPSGVFTSADENLIAAYCEAVSLHRQASNELNVSSPVVEGSQGQMVASPWARIQADQARLIVTLGARLGLDPVSRQALNTSDSADQDEFAGLVN